MDKKEMKIRIKELQEALVIVGGMGLRAGHTVEVGYDKLFGPGSWEKLCGGLYEPEEVAVPVLAGFDLKLKKACEYNPKAN